MPKRKILRKKVKILLTIIGMTCAIGVCSLSIQYLPFFKDKDIKPEQIVEKIYYPTLKPLKDSSKQIGIDILAVGNSDLYSAFHPLQLWNDYGMTSYVASGPKQNMALTYYMIEEILKYQKPKVLILELDNFFEKRGDADKAKALLTTYKTCFPLFRYTSKWNEIKNETYVSDELSNPRPWLKGYYFQTDIKRSENEMIYNPYQYGREPISRFTKLYFPKIMYLARQNNCEVIFLYAPSTTSWTYQKHNTIADYSRIYNVPFIDMNKEDYNAGIDWLTDSRDGGNHLNYNGAKKVTDFLGNYLKENYDLTDHRGDDSYIQWDKDYEYFESLSQKMNVIQ